MSEFTENPAATPPPAPATGKAPKKSNTGLVILITALVTAAVTSVLWIVGGIAFYAFYTAEPPPFTIEVDAPDIVEVGDLVSVQVTVSNHSQESATLGSVDIMDSLLDGFTIQTVEPKPSSQTSIFGIHSFYAKHKLKPSESASFTFTLKAVEPGYWGGTIDACTPVENYVSEWVEIEVIDEMEDEMEEAIGD